MATGKNLLLHNISKNLGLLLKIEI